MTKKKEWQSAVRMFELAAAALTIFAGGQAMAQDRIRISSEWGEVTAELADNEAARLLARMLPLKIEMRDHFRQEKTGNLTSQLPEVPRQQDFAAGTLGLWGATTSSSTTARGRFRSRVS